jgi:hypothetical protein
MLIAPASCSGGYVLLQRETLYKNYLLFFSPLCCVAASPLLPRSILLTSHNTMSNYHAGTDNEPLDSQISEAGQPQAARPEVSEEAGKRASSVSSAGSLSSSSSSVDYPTQLHGLQSRNTEVDLERLRTAGSQPLSRIETQRLQHALTVGRSIKSRASKASLPAFGAGKPYPPLLPAQEDYVVEFDGDDDPLYPQNWPLNKKYVPFNYFCHRAYNGCQSCQVLILVLD